MLSRNLLDPRSQQEYKSDDPIRQGFFDSTFFKPNAPSTMDVVNYTYQGNPMGGSSSQISQFRNYLDSIGKGDLLVNQNSGHLAQVGSGPLATSTPGENPYALNNPSNPLNQLNVTPPSEIPLSMQQPIPGLGAPPQGIGSLTPTPQQPGLGDLLGSGNENSFTPQQPVMPTSPYQEQLTGFGEQLTGFGNQLTGFNDQFGGFNDQFGGFNNQFKGLDKQFDMINTRLNSVDEGIASLSKQSQPQQQSYNSPYPNFNFRTNSYSNSSPFGLSSLFMGRY